MMFPFDRLTFFCCFFNSSCFVLTRFVKMGVRASGLLLLSSSRQSHVASCHVSGYALRFLCLAALPSYRLSSELLSRFSLMSLIPGFCWDQFSRLGTIFSLALGYPSSAHCWILRSPCSFRIYRRLSCLAHWFARERSLVSSVCTCQVHTILRCHSLHRWR